MVALFSWLASFLTGPLLKSAVDAWKIKVQASTEHDKLAADLAGRELLVQSREMELQTQLRVAQVGHWSEPEHLFGYTLWVYFAKCIIWDKVLATLTHGSTDPLTGAIDTWAGLIIMTYFGKRGAENIARIWRAK